MSRWKYISNLYKVSISYLLLLCLDLQYTKALHKPTGLTYTYTGKTNVHFTNIIYGKIDDRERRSSDRKIDDRERRSSDREIDDRERRSSDRKIDDRERRSSDRKKREKDRLPNSLTARFSVNDRSIDLSLYRNPKLSLNVPIYYHNSTGVTHHWSSDTIPSAFYQDVDNKASFHVECLNIIDDFTCAELELFGTFYVEEKFYIIESETVSNSSDSAKTTRPYIIYQTHVPQQYGNDHSEAERQTDSSLRNSSTGRSRRATGTYTVELFVVTDYSVYRHWYDASTQPTNQGKRNDAINRIKTFVGFHINGVDARLKSMNVGFTIDVTYAGLYIAETAASAPWTETVKTSSGTVDVVSVIGNFMQWVQTEKQAGNIPDHDHAMLFSRYDLISSTGSSDNIGYAYQGAMCTTNSLSVVEDQFNFIVETTAAHELGHSLGAKHDGIDNPCFADNSFIMAASSVAKTGNKARNPWIFSSCSAGEIDSLLNNLDSNGNNCLKTTDSPTNPNELNPYLTTEIGQIFDVNQQCEQAVGQGSYICLQFYTDFEKICTGLWCKSLTSAQCTLVLPADGTTCNSSKWCRHGNCVTSINAPVLPSTCLYGDSKGFVTTDYDCTGIGTTAPWYCYTYNTSCCVTCQSLETGRIGCGYGDKANCTAITSGAFCYNNEDLCCGTCEYYKTGITGCDYGDRTDCTGVTGPQCYAGNNAHICCHSCSGYYTGLPGCLYGDKATGCQATDCPFYSQTNLDICCYTCYQGIKPPTLGPITIPPPTTTPRPITTQASTQPPVPTTTTTVSTVVTETTGQQTTGSTLNQTTAAVTTASPPANNLPAWVIPVAATACAITVILVLICIFCYCQRTRKPKKPPSRGPSTISRNEFGSARPGSFTGISNVAYNAHSIPETDHYNYIPPERVSGPRVSRISTQRPPPARPPPRRPPQPLPSIKANNGQPSIRSTGQQPTTENTPHEYVEITDYEKLRAQPSTKSRTYESLKPNNQGVVKAAISAYQSQQYTNKGYNPS